MRINPPQPAAASSRAPFNISSKTSLDFNFGSSFTDKKKKEFYRSFSTLIKASVDFNRALELMAHQEKSKNLKKIYQEIIRQVIKGKNLHEVLAEYKDFSKYEVYSIKIGEETRRLPQVLDELEKFYSRKIKMKRQIISVITYPTFVLLITFGVLYFMLNYVVPMFSTVFRQFGGELPAITQFVQRLSDNFNKGLLIFVVFVLAILAAHFYLKNKEAYQEAKGKLLLKIPVFGNLKRKIAAAKLFQSMGLLLSAKTPLLDSLQLSREMTAFYPLQKTLDCAIMDVRKGSALSQSLEHSNFFQPKEIIMLRIGEEVNELDNMFAKLADQLEEDIDHSVKQVGSLLEPIMIIVIGVVVGFILIAMYYPMFSLGKVINQ